LDRLPAIRRAILAEVTPLRALGWSVLAVVVPTAVRWAADRGATGVPFLTYYPAVVLAALFLGWRWAVGVTLVCGAIANRVFNPEPLRFYMSGHEAVLVALFVLSCAALIWAGDTARRTVRALEAAKARESLLNKELLHRVKNLLATVNAMAVLTARHSDAANFVPALTGRMQALERATELLDVDENAPCEVHKLVEAALAPFLAGDNFLFDGPTCKLPQDACVPLSLALHELCTNASKYGALSVPEGTVSLNWTLEEGGALQLEWRERGGPPVTAPGRGGMGSQLLRRQRGLDRVEVHYHPAGVECAIAIAGVAAGA
jgi:two-component sensor histidine kinase